MAELLSFENPILSAIGGVADRMNIPAYVVGGYVRDLLMGTDSSDLDIVVVGNGIEFARSVAEKFHRNTIVTYERFGTAMLELDGQKVEFVGARVESYRSDSRNPEVRTGTLEDDLSRRDFTINAIALSLNDESIGEIHDPFNGRLDLRNGFLRTPIDPELTFNDDPLRMLRAIRFASRFGFTIDPLAIEAIQKLRERIAIVSQERITDELLKILKTKQPSSGFRLLHETGVLEIILPEIAQLSGVDQRKDYHHKDVFEHTMKVLDNVASATESLWLRFTALMHDVAKPKTKAFKEGIGWTFHGHEEMGARMMKEMFHRLKLPLEHEKYVEKLIRLHLRPMALVDEDVTDSALRRLLFDAGEDLDDLLVLCRADITSKNPTLVSKILSNYDIVVQRMGEVEERDRIRSWQPPVRGEELMERFGLTPGPAIGILKKSVEEAILDGRIPNDHDSALQYLDENKTLIFQSISEKSKVQRAKN